MPDMVAIDKPKSPCNCGQSASALPESAEMMAFEAIPSLEALEGDLDAAVAEDSLAASELDLALATNELAPEEELAFASLEDTSGPTLDSIAGVLQRFPGLKVTFSF